jgi:hypothetical protein
MIAKDGSWYWVSPSGEGCLPAKFIAYKDPYYVDDFGYFEILGYPGGYSEHDLICRVSEDDEITNLETIQFIENTAKLYRILESLYKDIPKEYQEGLKNRLNEIFDNSKQLDSEDVEKRIEVSVDHVFLGDIPEGSYFWYNGKRYKKSKDCKEYVKVSENLSKHIFVFVEKK